MFCQIIVRRHSAEMRKGTAGIWENLNSNQGVANINFRYEWIYLYPKNDTNEYPNIFVSKRWYERISEYIRIKKAIRMNIRIYSYQKNDTNMIRTNIHIGKYSNVRIHLYKIFDISFRLDARGWIFDVWYNRKLKHSWHNKIEVIFLWTLIFVWTIWAIYLLDLLAQTLDFSLEYIWIKKRFERISEYIRIKNEIPAFLSGLLHSLHPKTIIIIIEDTNHFHPQISPDT